MVHVIQYVSRDRHKHKKHGHATTKKYNTTVDSKVSHDHKTITLDNIPDSLLPHRSLINFVDDRSKLLDEVFSIFSEEEISNMLPDILKGIKLDEVQKLCYEQLKAMDSTAITQILQSQGDSGVSSKDVDSNEDDVKVTCDHQISHDSSNCNESLEADVIAAKNSPENYHSTSDNVIDLLNDKPSPNGCQNFDKNISTANATTNVIECSGEDSIELLATVGDDIDRELTSSPLSTQEDSSKQVVPILTRPVSIKYNSASETDVLTELYMRKKALQSQLKKQQLEKKINAQRAKEELLLRQKALQSLLAANVSKTKQIK